MYYVEQIVFRVKVCRKEYFSLEVNNRLSSYGRTSHFASSPSLVYTHSIFVQLATTSALYGGGLGPIWLTSVPTRDPVSTNHATTRSSMFLGLCLCHVLESVTLLVGDSDCSVLLQEARSVWVVLIFKLRYENVSGSLRRFTGGPRIEGRRGN